VARQTELRARLVAIALEWQKRYGVAPPITSPLSELDASRLVGMPDEAYSEFMQDKTAVAMGSDFEWRGTRYQVKANRPSGKPGSRVTLVAKAKNYDWDHLIWILYNAQYEIEEAWQWDVASYRRQFHDKMRLAPSDYRAGTQLA
jgi:hypothetical protein